MDTMSYYFRPIKEMFNQLNLVITKENKKDINRVRQMKI